MYAIHCYGSVYKAIAQAEKPRVLRGTDIDNFGKIKTDKELKGMLEIVKDCQVFDFPQVRHDFSDTKIYWRKEVAGMNGESANLEHWKNGQTFQTFYKPRTMEQ